MKQAIDDEIRRAREEYERTGDCRGRSPMGGAFEIWLDWFEGQEARNATQKSEDRL
jgi:hypothetical protein